MCDLSDLLGASTVVEVNGCDILRHYVKDYGPTDELSMAAQGEDEQPGKTDAPVTGVEEQARHDGDVSDRATGPLDPRAGCVVLRLRLGKRDLPDRDAVDNGGPAPDFVRVLKPRPGIGDSLHGVAVVGVDPFQHGGEHGQVVVLALADGALWLGHWSSTGMS
jgi:hypothetical protein